MGTSDHLYRVYKKVSRYSLFREGATNTARKEPIEALINL
jgi:hypothetical protein